MYYYFHEECSLHHDDMASLGYGSTPEAVASAAYERLDAYLQFTLLFELTGICSRQNSQRQRGNSKPPHCENDNRRPIGKKVMTLSATSRGL